MAAEYQPKEFARHKATKIEESSQEIPKPTVTPFNVAARQPGNASVRIGERNWVFYYSSPDQKISYIVGTGFNYQDYRERDVTIEGEPVKASPTPLAVAVEATPESKTNIHLFYVDKDYKLHELVSDSSGIIFKKGDLDKLSILVSPGNGISALGSAEIKLDNYNVWLYYTPSNDPGRIYVTARTSHNEWNKGVPLSQP